MGIRLRPTYGPDVVIRSRALGVRVAAPVIWALLILAAPASATECTRNADATPATGKPLKKQTKLTPEVQATIVNFGSLQGKREIDLVFTASPALPRSVKPRPS